MEVEFELEKWKMCPCFWILATKTQFFFQWKTQNLYYIGFDISSFFNCFDKQWKVLLYQCSKRSNTGLIFEWEFEHHDENLSFNLLIVLF